MVKLSTLPFTKNVSTLHKGKNPQGIYPKHNIAKFMAIELVNLTKC